MPRKPVSQAAGNTLVMRQESVEVIVGAGRRQR